MQENSLYVFVALGFILVIGLYFILKPGNDKREKNKQSRKSEEVKDVEANLEQVENLNMVMFLLHDMAKEYSKADYNRDAIEEFVGKIVVSKSWEERLSNLPKQTDNDEAAQ